MKIFTEEDILNINKRYNEGRVISRYEKLWFQTIYGVRKAGIKYFLNDEELKEYAKCYNSVEYFIEKYCKVKLEDGKIGPIEIRDYQRDAIKHYKDNRFSIFFNSRQMGIQTILCLIFIHEILFNNDKHILIVSYKGETNKKIIKRIKDTYRTLPFFLKMGVVNWNEKQLNFENKSHISTLCPTKNIAIKCAHNYDIVFFNDFSQIINNEEIYRDIVPNIMSTKDSKLVINSSANGFNLFYKLVQDAERSVSDPLKNVFSCMRTYWWQIQGRLDTKIKFIDNKLKFHNCSVSGILNNLKNKGLDIYEKKIDNETIYFIKFDINNHKTHIENIRQIICEYTPLNVVAEITNWKEETINILGSEMMFEKEYNLSFISDENEFKNFKRTETIDKMLDD
jgi:hypothetical protein